MRKLLICIGVGFFTGFVFTPKGSTERNPIPPSQWTHSSLLREFHAMEDRMRTASYESLDPANPYLRFREPDYERNELEAHTAAKILLSNAETLTGIFHPIRSKSYRGENGVRITCTKGTEESCCSEELHRSSSNEKWEIGATSQGATPWDGFQNDRGNFLFIYEALRPYEKGLPFVGTFVELPLHNEKETNFLGFDPDARAWKVQGKIVWTKSAPVEGCVW